MYHVKNGDIHTEFFEKASVEEWGMYCLMGIFLFEYRKTSNKLIMKSQFSHPSLSTGMWAVSGT